MRPLGGGASYPWFRGVSGELSSVQHMFSVGVCLSWETEAMSTYRRRQIRELAAESLGVPVPPAAAYHWSLDRQVDQWCRPAKRTRTSVSWRG